MRNPGFCTLLFFLGASAENILFGPSDSHGACAGIGERLTEFQGVIRSPVPRDWFDELNCTWVIVATAREMVNVRFDTFDLPCYTGLLTLWSPGRTPSRLCSSYRPRSLTFLGGSVHVHLRAAYGSRFGFKLSFVRGFPCQAGWTLCGNGDCVPASLPCSPRTPLPRPSPPPVPCPCPAPRTLGGFFGSFASPDYGAGRGAWRAACDCGWRLDTGDPRPLVLSFPGLALGPGDLLEVRGAGGELLARLSPLENEGEPGSPAALRTPSGAAAVRYRSAGGPGRGGFNATYQVRGYCPPWEHPCKDGGAPACYSDSQRCDGAWDCEGGGDEDGCGRCPAGRYPCGGRTRACYGPGDRCNYQTYCPGGGDEQGCRQCQLGTFHCADDRCIFETWVCDGQPDCRDGSDERNCERPLPRKVATAAVVGSLICGLLLVVAMGCTCKLYSLRTSQYSLFTPLAHMDVVQRQAPPSYGELISQGAIPPVEDFPTENPNDTSVIGNIRSILQLLRQESPHRASRRRRRNRYVRRLSRRFRRSRLYALLSRSGAVGRPSAATPDPAAPTPDPAPDPVNPPAASSSSEALPLPRKFPLLDSSPPAAASHPGPDAPVLASSSSPPRGSVGADRSGDEDADVSPADPRDVLLLPLTGSGPHPLGGAEGRESDVQPLIR